MNLDRLYRRNYPIVAAVIAALGVIGIALVSNVGRSQVVEARLTERVRYEAKKEAAKAVDKEVNQEVANEVTEQLSDLLLPNNATPPNDPNNPFNLTPPTTLPAEGPFDLTTTTTGPPPGPIQPPPPDETTTTTTPPEVPTTVTLPDLPPLP